MLTDKKIIQAKPQEKTYRLYDQHGLYLEVAPSGGKWWRLKYRFQGKEKRISLGVYPFVTLKEAREKTFTYKKNLAEGIEPKGVQKKHLSKSNTFESVAREWHKKMMAQRNEEYKAQVMRAMEREIFPFIGDIAIDEIDAPSILAILRRIEERGLTETPHKIKSYISQTMRYGIACGLIYHDPARDLSGALRPKRRKPMAAIIEPQEVGRLMHAIDGYPGGLIRCAMKFGALTFVRPGELRHGEWKEIDFNTAEWRIPAEKMKIKKAHIVPLSSQALDVLDELKNFSIGSRYLFHSARTLDRPMSENGVNAALRYLGYNKDDMTGHGFRAMASSLLAERGWSIDAIERQLAHVERNTVRAAYHRSSHLEERRRMMQDWADYLDELRDQV